MPYTPPGGTGSQSEELAIGGDAPVEPDVVYTPGGDTPNPKIGCGGSNGSPAGGAGSCNITVTPDLPEIDTLFDPPSTGIYGDYNISEAYETDYHTLQMPKATTADHNASFAVVAQPTMKKVVNWTATKANDWPDLPKAETSDPNEILLFKYVTGRNIELAADQLTPVYIITGRYIYAYVDPDLVNMYVGVPPYVDWPISDSAIPPDKFVDGIQEP
jgi:hypothetical protein